MDKVSPAKQKKIETVGQFEEKIKRARGLVLTDYRGLTHRQLETLKKALKLAEAELIVTKNTLLKLAIEKVSKVGKVSEVSKGEKTFDTFGTFPSFDTSLQGPTATLFAYGDIIAPLKELAKMIKALKLPLIKFGLLEGTMITGEDVLRLATLPSREVLIAQVVGGLKSPIFGLHRALGWNLQKLVMTLSAIQQKKS